MVIIRRFIFLFLLCAIFTARLAFALDVPDKPDGYVNDYAGALSSETRARLTEDLKNFETTDSTQIVVAIFPSLEGDSLEDFSMRLAQQWHIGQKGKDNGAILLIFPNDHQLRIEVGYGLEHRLTDALSDSIIRHEITPEFKKDDFDQGVLNGIAAIESAVRGEYKGNASDESNEDWINTLFTILWLLVFFFFSTRWFFVLLFGQRYSSSGRSSFWSGGGSGSGFSSGGSFGGGGGSFGGGGASGRW